MSYKQKMKAKANALAENQKLRRTTQRCKKVAGGFQYKPPVPKVR